jgi:hypothetical protein
MIANKRRQQREATSCKLQAASDNLQAASGASSSPLYISPSGAAGREIFATENRMFANKRRQQREATSCKSKLQATSHKLQAISCNLRLFSPFISRIPAQPEERSSLRKTGCSHIKGGNNKEARSCEPTTECNNQSYLHYLIPIIQLCRNSCIRF